MSGRHPVYSFLVSLYPRDFRRDYGDALVQHFADLVADRGARSAWARTSVDLIVTLPQYRLESIMSEQRSATALNVAIVLLASGGVMSVLTGLYPGAVLIIAAIVLAIAQRSTLARAIRTPDSSRRLRLLTLAAALAAVFAVTIVGWTVAISDGEVGNFALIASPAVGVPAMVGAIACLVAGLLTPRTARSEGVAPRV